MREVIPVVRAQVIDARNYIADWSANPTAWTAYWQAAHDAAIAAGAELVVTPGVYKLDLTPGAKINVSSGFRMRGEGPHVIQAYNGNSTTTTGCGFYIDAATVDKTDISFEDLIFDGDNGPLGGGSFSFQSNRQTMCIRVVANGTGIARNIRVRGCTFKHLWGFPVQVIGVAGKASHFFFDDNECFQVSRALNCSAPYSALRGNKFEQSQVMEIAAPHVSVIGNTAFNYYGNLSLGASGVSSAGYIGYVILGNNFHQQIQSAASAVITTGDGAACALIADNIIRRANGAGIYLGAAVSAYGAPRSIVANNQLISCGNIANGLTTRYGIWVAQQYVKVVNNTVWNDPADAGAWEAVVGLAVQENDGVYDGNRLDGTTWDVQFDATGANTKAARNIWGPTNNYDPAKVNFLRSPTGLSHFIAGSVMRFNPSGLGARPAASANYRGLRALTQGGAGVADTDAVCVKDAADAYAWQSLF